MHLLNDLLANTAEFSSEEPTVSVNASQEDLDLIWNWNSSVPDPVHGCVHSLIAEIAGIQPSALAVDAWDGQLTYLELDALANRVAQQLIDLGITPKSNVPICFEKTRWTPVAMLGVIKSGCAAIALDPAQPDARLRSVVQQAQPGVIISSTANYERASLLADVPVFKLDETLLHLPEHSSRLPVVSPLDTAYISFTSGTTGLPKGACISHANVRSAVEYQGKKLGFCCESRVLDFAPYSFDVAWSNFLHTICAGGCICIASEQDMMNDLSSTIQVFNASLINVTPTVLRTISPIPSTLRTVLLSGEMPYRENLIWARHVRLLNTYGPTECTFKCAFSLLPSTKDERPDIGVGVGFGTWIVHPHDTDKLVSRGAVGELYLEGPLVGQGYLSNPEQTSTAFIHDPPWLLTGSSKFAGRRGRLYKTRDLVKYKTDGKLLFIGRKDASQLKIRGQRVEIGDVEYHARACLDDELPIIADVVHPAGNGSPSLVLFVNVKEHERERAKPLIDGLSQKLSKVLPSFMVPSFYLPVEEIPLAATGKVDRRRLREIGNGLSREDLNSLQSSIMTSAEYRKPSNEIEHHLRQLWARVLDLSPARISTTDSFFRLGGDSVAAVCLVAAAREKSLMLTAADIFRTPQLSDLANITRAQAKSQHDEAPAPFSLLNGKKEKLAVCQEAARLCGVEITEIEDVYPCTPLQQGMLAMTSRRAGDYISKVVFRLPHELDVGKFQKAWEATVKQISILRTRIIELSRNGLVNVVLSSPVTLHAHFPDGASLSQRGGMGLGTPLCRAGLLNGDRRLFYLEMHHAIHDGWCTMLILDTIAQAYRAEQTTFWPLVSFQSFIRYSMAIDVPKATEFWERQLSGLRATVFPSPSSNGGINMDFYHPISGLQWPSTNITASSIIRSATAMLLALYTNSDDVKFGTTISGRQASVTGIERMAGPTIATVPVRIKFGWDQTVEDLHEQIQSQALEMTDFEQFGLQRIQHITQDTQEASQFQLLLVVQPAVQGSSQQQGGLFSRRCTDSGDDLILEQTKSMGMFNSYAMMIICELEESGLKLRINFDSGAIQDIQVRRIAHQLELLLRQFCTEEGRNMKLCHVSALSEQDLVEISEWNRHIPRPTLNPVIDWIDTKSLAQPDVLAVSAWDMKITYYQLGRLSTSLAAKMRDKGVGTGSIIPLVFEKSAWMTVSILAILKAGATALPMSVSASIHRAHKVLHALGPKLVITSSIPESSAFYGFVPVFHISELVEPDRVDGTEKTRLAQPVSADPAIIIFTSGSTGTPKSISWSHASLSSNVHAAVSAFKITTGSRVFQFSAYDFDVSSLEALATLVAGGCLCVPSEDHRSDHLAEAIHEMQANWICLTPSVANTILPKDVPSLKTLVFTGEKLLQDPATRWTSTLHHLYNWYGPAEASCATVCTVEDETWKPGMIGRSIYGSSWLVDPKDHNFLAPIGTIAELCIEGPILANGYIGGDSQTSPENPFIFPRWLHHGRDVISGRNRPIYKTGDLVKYDSKGSIIFIGRSDDFQRKLRGQRVELSEIEHQVQCFLSKTTDTTIVAEIFRPQKSENEVLTLFVSPPAVLAGSAKELDHFMKRIFPVDDLERSLSDVLPPYMIPKLYIPILKIPTGYTGKIDRQRLRQIGSSLTLDQLAKIQPSRRELRKPSTYMEKVLQNLWAEIIGIERDTIHAGDNFLRLGGDSISAMRLVASAYAQGLSLTVAQVFQTPQLDKLAEVVKQDVNSPQQGVPPFTLLDLNIAHTEARLYAAEVCQVPHSHVIDMYPCTALQEGLLAMTVRRPGQYVSRSVLELQTGVDPERLEKAWRATTEKLTILRTRIIDYPGRGLFQVILVNVSWRTGDNVDAYLKEDEREEMGLGTDLCRAAIIDNRFILTIHHCIYDGSLLRMMLDELESKYLEQGGMNVTPFQNFIQYSTNVDPEAASKFWKQQIPNLEFRQFPVVPSPTYDPQANEDLSHGISLDWPSSGMTPSTIIRSTWAVLSAQYTDSGDVIFGATVSGRQADMKGIEDCVGPTISTVPVAVSIDWDETIRNFQKRIQHQSVSMMSYEHYGLSNIQRAIGDPGSGLFQTLLVVQPVAQGKSLQEDSLLFKARSFSSNIDTRGTDPFNTYALMLICELKTSGLQLHISFDNRLVQSGQIQRIAHQFETVLHQMCIADAESRKLGDICTASDIDLSFFWSENAEPYRAPQMCAHDQVASAARKTPESIAVDAWDGKFSYREVDELSDIFCQNLISLGVTRGSIIALCLEKSKWTPIAQLAVLKAGGVCLLQSVHMPERRMSSIFSSVGPHLAVASEMRSKIVTKYIRCFTISRLMERPIEDSIRTSLPEMSINDPAAILVSSGSTGEPKRILWTHRTLAANMNAHKEVAALSTSSRTFQFTSHDFDACTIETMSTLANSACLCIPSESERFDGVTAAINRFDCNLACLTPSTAKLLSPQEVPSLSTLFLGGENLVQEEVDRWRGRSRILNWYGPCECSAAAFCAADEEGWHNGMIGRSNSSPSTFCWLVNPKNHNKLVPFGAIGEIALEGPACAEKYQGNPELSNRSFCKDPDFLLCGRREGSPGRHGQIYRTGDLARYDSSGRLIFLGRKDALFKVRGQLVAPEEVEFHVRRLSRRANIDVVAELIVPKDGNNACLVAFISFAEAETASQDEFESLTAGMNEGLKASLPAFAIPSYYIPVASIPMTSTGKKDRIRLREIGASFQPQQQGTDGKREPATTAERTLRELWSCILRVDAEKISTSDSFLRLGDSIQAMRLVGAARQQGLSLKVADIFQFPKLKNMAKLLRNQDEVDEESSKSFLLLNPKVNVDQARQHAASLCNVEKDTIEDLYPCTPLQEGLLALTGMRKDDYVGHNMLKLASTVDVRRLKEAWEKVVSVIPILRTRIIDLPAQGLVQAVIRHISCWMEAESIEDYLSKQEELPMVLGSPLMRCGLFLDPESGPGGERSHVFALTLHHSIYDGLTTPIIFEVLERYYNGETPLRLFPFRSFIEYVSSQHWDAEGEFWKAQFDGLETTQFPALPSSSFKPKADSSYTHMVDGITWRTDDSTPSTVVRGAWAILCSRYTNLSDTVFGTIVSGRKAPTVGIERIAGPTISALPIRVNIDNGRNIVQFLQALQDQATKMISYEQTGLSKISRCSEEAKTACQFQTMLVVQPEQPDMMDSGLFVSEVGPSKRHKEEHRFHAFNTYALLAVCTVQAGQLKLELSFDSKVIGQATIQKLVQHFEQLLRNLCSRDLDTVCLRDVSMMTHQDLDQVWKWNARLPKSIEVCAHDMITNIAQAHPDAVAISAWDGELTYSQLDELSSAIAHRLIGYGVDRNMIVPLCFEKSLWMPVAFLSVMKAGGAGLFLDPTLPISRLEATLDQVEPRIILSSPSNKRLSSRLVANVLLLGAETDLLRSCNAAVTDKREDPLPNVGSADLLFAIFTSGSTGSPKGCLLQHRNFSSAVSHQRDVLQLDRSSRMYDFSSYAFDAAHWSALHVLCAGGTLCIPSEEERKNNLTDSIRRFRTTSIFLTPATARLIDPTRIPTLQSVYLGGEEVKTDDLAPWVSSANVAVVYGPTECSAMATYWSVPSTLPRQLSIGTGVGVLTWVIDPLSNTRLCPIGTIGELCLEGPLVGAGYLHDEEKTESAFLENPTWLMEGSPDGALPGRGGRVYRTGDLVKYNPADGTLLFLGRKDRQTKLRGQRVELSEVEHHVQQCLGRTHSVPTMIADIVVPKATEKDTLVVFIQHESQSTTQLDELVNHLQIALPERLPLSMVPSAYIPIEAVPLTASGKIDRRHLRQIGADLTIEQLAGATEAAAEVPVSTDAEHCLRQLWAVVLGLPIETIGANSGFLRLGGDSIAAMRLAALARSQSIDLTVQHILRSPRLSEMAKAITSRSRPSDTLVEEETVEPFSLLRMANMKDKSIAHISRLCGTQASDIEDAFPCTDVQKSLLSVTAKRPGDYIARLLLELRDDLDIDRLKQAWEDVSRSTAPILRSRIVDIPIEGLIQVQLGEQLEWQTSPSLQAYLEYDQRRPMGLSSRLTRLAIVEQSETGRRYCVLTQHHAIYDGHSLDLLLEEVSNSYMGEINKYPVAPFQAFLKHTVRTDKENAREFWRHQFSDSEAVPFPMLPYQDYQPKADSTVKRNINDMRWPDRDVTASTVIRTAWSILSACYTDSKDLVFGALVTGRQAPIAGIERMIAPLISALPVRVKFNPKMTVNDLLENLQKQSIDMIPYEHTVLLDACRTDTNTKTSGHFNTLLVVQPAGDGAHVNHSGGPFRTHSELKVSTDGLDTFNPHAVMIMCQLRHTSDLSIEISFDSKVVDVVQMERIASQFEQVLRQVCTSSTHLVEDIETVSTQDITELWGWNSSVPRPNQACVHDSIRDTVLQQPQAPAICSWDGNLSYAELDDLSDRLASQLATLGAGPGTVIPLCFEKSLWMPVAALATMKSGAACLAMDSTQPEARLRSIVKQVNPRLIISSVANETLATRISNSYVVVADKTTLPLQPCQSPIKIQLPKVSPLDILYIVFTSGSTGTPKGVVTTHENFSSAAMHQAKALHVKRGTRVFDFVSYNFDVSWSNTLNTLICGGCLCIPSEWERKNDIPSSLNRMNADYVYFTPSVARSLDPSAMPGIRTLAMGGEPIQSAEVARWAQAETIIGIYGPAECAQALSIVPLGPRTPNNHVGHSFGALTWLVQPDRPNHLAAIGAIGELLIEGPTVSQGYFDDEAKTAAAFMHDPPWLTRGLEGHPGRHGRLYKTGDLLKYNTDGSLQFIGRKDTLIKLRGQRIELEEVEHHVRASLRESSYCDGVAAEIIMPQNSEHPILAVFLSLARNGNRSNSDIRSRLGRLVEDLEESLSEHLPQYMVPGAYIPIDKIPMTTTNKTDRRALRELGGSKTLERLAELQPRGKERRAPSTMMEKRLQILWSAVLGIEASSISADSSFLRIGGESIAAMRLVAAARDQQLLLTVADIFKAPRLSQLAQLVTEVTGEKESSQALPPFSLLKVSDVEIFLQESVQPFLDQDVGSIKNVFPTTDFQERAILDALQDPPNRFPHWILDLSSDIDFARLKRACEELVKYFDILHTVFIPADYGFLQVLIADFKPTFDLFEVDDGTASSFTNTICEEDLKRDRKLGHSFIRFMAIKHHSGKHRLIFRLSHAQFDGFSFGLVLKSLSSIYSEESLPIPPAFGEVIAFNETKKNDSMQYWASRLNGCPFPESSTGDPTGQAYNTGDRLTMKETIEMPSVRWFDGVSPATVFHAACALALSQQFQRDEVVFGRLVTGRSMLPTRLQKVVGPCLTEVPVRLRIEAGDSMSDIAMQLQPQFIQDSVHEAMGMVEIIKSCTEWPKEVQDFGWRTAYQQEEDTEFTFAGWQSNVSVYERDLLPRNRPEIYATPRSGKLELEFEGNRKLIDEGTVREFLLRLRTILCEH